MNVERLVVIAVLFLIAKWEGFAIGNSERHQKYEKCRMQFFVFLLSAVRRHEGGGKRPPELPLRNPFHVPI